MNPCPAGDCSPAGAQAESQCAPPACPAPPPPPPAPGARAVEQVHISLTGVASEMHVSFVSNASCSSQVGVAFGATLALGERVMADGALLTSGMDSPICIFSATMQGLTAGATHYYRIDGDNRTFDFPVAPVRPGGNVYLVMADYGTENDISQAQLVAESEAGAWDAIIYSGDMVRRRCQRRVHRVTHQRVVPHLRGSPPPPLQGVQSRVRRRHCGQRLPQCAPRDGSRTETFYERVRQSRARRQLHAV
jgi:hypothetical protein